MDRLDKALIYNSCDARSTVTMSKSPDHINSSEHIVVFGYGAQGRAQALNLRDSGAQVSIYLRADSPSIPMAKESGLPIITDPNIAAKEADIALMLIPDSEQPAFYKEYLHGSLPLNSSMAFAHGFAIHYGQISPRKDLDIILVAPLAHASAVRDDYLAGNGVPCMVAVAQDATSVAHTKAHALAKFISKTGPFIDTTFAEEVETDLFAEQALLCGGMPELVKATFDTLVAAGYNEDVAYFSCLKELRPIVNLLDKHAISGMRMRISDTARFGSLTRGPRIVNDETKNKLNKILSEICSGQFTKEFIEESKDGHKNTMTKLQDESKHPIERIHRRYNP